MNDDDFIDFEVKKKNEIPTTKQDTTEIKNIDKTWIFIPRGVDQKYDLTVEIMEATPEEFCLWIEKMCPVAYPGANNIVRDPSFYNDRTRREKAFISVMASLNRVGVYIKG